MTKWFHHSAILSTPSNDGIWCPYSLSSSFVLVLVSAHTACLVCIGYGFILSLTHKENVSLKHSCEYICIFNLYFPCFCTSHSASFYVWTCSEVVYSLFSFIVRVKIISNYCLFWTYLFCLFINLSFLFYHLWSGSLCTAVVVFHTLASLIMLAHFLTLQKPTLVLNALIMVVLHLPICCMCKLLYANNIIFCAWTYWGHIWLCV